MPPPNYSVVELFIYNELIITFLHSFINIHAPDE